MHLYIEDRIVKGLRECPWFDLTRIAGTHKSIPKDVRLFRLQVENCKPSNLKR